MKILILAYDFPPLNSSGGLRPYSWYKYFPRANVYPIVITRNWSDNINTLEDKIKLTNFEMEKIETDYSLLIKLPHQHSIKEKLINRYGMNKKILVRKALSFFESYLKYHLTYFDDKQYIYKYADAFLSQNKVDCILATGEPFILFKYANILSKKYNTPWLADYRDGWSTDHAIDYNSTAALSNGYLKNLERKHTDNLNAFVSVSPQVVAKIEKVIRKKGVSIPNGVDLDLIESVSANADEKTLTIVYSGVVYEGQNVEDFLTAYEKVLKKTGGDNILVKFIGISLYDNTNTRKIAEFSKKFPKNLAVLPRMSHEESIRDQKKATLLLNFILGSQSEGLIGAKTYEYIAIKKPIIVIPLNRETKPPLFPNRNIQHFVYNADEIQKLLEKFYDEFRQGKKLTTDISDAELYEISREKSAFELVDFIKENIGLNHFKMK